MKKLPILLAMLWLVSGCESLNKQDKVLFLSEDDIHAKPTAKIVSQDFAQPEPPAQTEVVFADEDPAYEAGMVSDSTVEEVVYVDEALPVLNHTKSSTPRGYGYTPQTTAYETNITPEVYGIVAKRTVNKMLDETAPLYEKAEAPTIFIREVKIEDDRLPDGFFYANKLTRQLLENANTFKVVNNKYDADYFLETEVDTVEFKNSPTPAIVYRVMLLDQRNGVIKEWKETIRQLKNDDKSWW